MPRVWHTVHMSESASPKTPAAVFANRVREARQLRGLSQAELARRLSLDRTTISHIESGKRSDVSISQLFAFADALGLAPVYLLSPRRVDAQVRLTPFGEPVSGSDARDWIRGKAPASPNELAAWLLALPQDEQLEFLVENDPEIAATADSPIARLLVDRDALAERIRSTAVALETVHKQAQDAATRRRTRSKEGTDDGK